LDCSELRANQSRYQEVKVSGLISSAAWGQGRSSADRQFYYVNGRPCDLKPISRAINEVYKSFNTNQTPLSILDFRIPAGQLSVLRQESRADTVVESVDINVSPDKRTIFLHSEVNLISALRVSQKRTRSGLMRRLLSKSSLRPLERHTRSQRLHRLSNLCSSHNSKP
jgi:DNA mismatch repair ATPase MutL